MATQFIAFVALMASLVLVLIARYLGVRIAGGVAAGLGVWLLYVGAMSYFGVIGNTALRPPGPVFLFVPLIAFLVFFVVRSHPVSMELTAMGFPLALLLGLQTFRVGVEWFLHELWRSGLIPKMLTYEGANVDIYVGATAPLIAWLVTRGRWGLNVALVWNIAGLLVLGNVVVRAVLTAPGPLHCLHTDVPNLMIGTFPYTFIPAFFVLLAVVLHVLAIRGIQTRSTRLASGL